MSLDCAGDFPRVLYCQEMTHDLTIMLGLPRKAKGRVLLLCNFAVRHHLDFLRRIGRTNSIGLRLWDFAVHQSGLRIERMK